MGFARKIQYYLVHTLKYSNKAAVKLMSEGGVKINNRVVTTNCILRSDDEIKLNDTVVQENKPFVYIKYYKPVGFVSSLNKHVENSLFPFFEDKLPLFIAGRLDKYSEGLLILTNDGKWLKNITDPNSGKEKEYIVTVDQPFDSNFIEKMSTGVDIKFYVTKVCFCEPINDHEFKIILTEGKNKQIRRMCKSFGYQVIKLKRTRIDTFELENMKPGHFEMLNK